MTETITAGDIRKRIETFVQDYPGSRGVPHIWRTPLAAFAWADDRFDILPKIAAPDHIRPRDLLPEARSVVVFFIPFVRSVAQENHPGDTPCRNWGLAYQTTNALINDLCGHLRDCLHQAGHSVALIPATHNFDVTTLMARWSHKHIGYIAGLGRFGVNAQFITPSGCAGRLGSLVTSAKMGNAPLVSDAELCLHKLGRDCLACVRRCPVGAVSETTGIDRQKCWDRLNENRNTLPDFQDMAPSTHVCAKCQVLVPCSLSAPLSRKKEDL